MKLITGKLKKQIKLPARGFVMTVRYEHGDADHTDIEEYHYTDEKKLVFDYQIYSKLSNEPTAEEVVIIIGSMADISVTPEIAEEIADSIIDDIPNDVTCDGQWKAAVDSVELSYHDGLGGCYFVTCA